MRLKLILSISCLIVLIGVHQILAEDDSDDSESSSEASSEGDSDSDASTESHSDSTESGDNESDDSDDSTGKKANPTTEKANTRMTTTTEESEVKGSSEDRIKSQCPKNCQKSIVKKHENMCKMSGYKISEKVKTTSECLDKCKNFEICGSAAFATPRTVTTHDLTSLYQKVINYENWVPIKEQGGHIQNYGLDGSDEGEGDDIDDNDLPQYDDEPSLTKVNTSALKTSKQKLGFCYIFEDKSVTEDKLSCSPSQLTFTYDEIQCTDDQKCLDKIPRKKCSRGKCGKTCKEFNTVHIPNACMAKYFFGHLEADSLNSCLEFCLSNKECKSVDFGNMGSCLINYVTRNDTQLTMGCDAKNNEIWDYYEIIDDSECASEKPRPSPNEDVCLNSPGVCKNGGDCQSIQLAPPEQSFKYECNCPCNWCGKHCDKLNMKTFRNGCLNSSVLVWSVAESPNDCIDICLDEIHCKSVSYSATSGTCVLHWADHTTEPIVASSECPSFRTDVIESEWSLFEIICNTSSCHSSVEVIESNNLKGCASNPCLNGGECADIFQMGDVVGYHCLCKCGYCGDRCESQNYVTTDNACIWRSHISDNPNDYYRKSVPLHQCLDVCASKYPLCRSVDFSNQGECLLNNRDSDTAAVTTGCNNYMRQRWALHDLSCVCNNKPVLY